MTTFVGFTTKIYSYLIDGGNDDKKGKETKKCVIKRKFNFEYYKNCSEVTQLENKKKLSRKKKN